MDKMYNSTVDGNESLTAGIDLDMVKSEYEALEKEAADLWKENCSVSQRLNQTEKRLAQANKTSVHQQYMIKTLQDTVRSTHVSLASRCDLQDENRKLKDTIKSMQQKEQQHEKEHAEQCAALERQMQQLIEEHKTDLSNQQMAFNDKLAEAEMQHSTQVASFKSLSDEANRQHDVQLMKLQIDYDEKIKKLQKQLSAAQVPTSQLMATNQEIFRKKVQHMKTEHQQEIDTLQRQISDLQRQLQQQQQAPPTQHSANQHQQAPASNVPGSSTLSFRHPRYY